MGRDGARAAGRGWRKDDGPGKVQGDGPDDGGSLPGRAAPSGDFSGKAGGDVGRGRVGDHAHPCAVSPKKAIRGLFSLLSGLLSRKITPPPQHGPGAIPRRPALGCDNSRGLVFCSGFYCGRFQGLYCEGVLRIGGKV